MARSLSINFLRGGRVIKHLNLPNLLTVNRLTMLSSSIFEVFYYLGRERQFEKMPEEDVVSFGSPYDSGSVMQYDGRSFSKNGKPTIVDRYKSLVKFYKNACFGLWFYKLFLKSQTLRLEH